MALHAPLLRGRNRLLTEGLIGFGDYTPTPPPPPPNVTKTPTFSRSTITDPLTGHIYTFVAADGITPELRVVGQYQDGTWFVLGGPANIVRIGSIFPFSTSVSTEGYTVKDNLNDTGVVGVRTRWMHGAMVNPWQGVAATESAPLGFDNYYATSNPAGSAPYLHSLNVDPGATNVPLALTEGSIVKAESLPEEGLHSSANDNKTRILKFSCLTVVPEIPDDKSFRPPIRGVDKKSYWTLNQLDFSSKRQKIAGMRPYTTTQIDAATSLIAYIQNTFTPYQEPARRWNPGARGGGVDIYGDKWYGQFARFFGTFHGDYTDAEVEGITRATVQVGIDIYGLMKDNSYFHAWQAHHAGRKGIGMAAGLLLNNADILTQCDAALFPNHFGVDDAYCDNIVAPMVGHQPKFYKGAFPYKWETVQIGTPEWSSVFPDNNVNGVTTQDQVVDPDIARRSYQVLSFDNGAMMQGLWGMIMDPTARYYKPAYFNFMDRYLAIRFGDQIDGVWSASNSNNGHFTGNWHSIAPTNTFVGYFKQMRDASSRTSYVPFLKPEALPKPQVTHTGTNGWVDVNFNTNNFRMPQHKDAAITRYDLRWTAYAGGAATAASESVPEYIGNFAWHQIENITMPYQLSAVPSGVKIKVQIRMWNANGPGPWLDDRKRENYAPDSTTFSILAGSQRYSTNFDVPDIAAFYKVPMNFGRPQLSSSTGVIVGNTVTISDGIWTASPATTATNYVMQISDDGLAGWTDIPGATTNSFTALAGQVGKYIRPGVAQVNSIGAAPFVYGDTPVKIITPIAIEGNLQEHDAAAFNPGFGALGGKTILLLSFGYGSSVITEGGTVGAHTFGAAIASDNVAGGGQGQFKSFAYLITVPPGETSETIQLTFTGSATSLAYELTADLELLDFKGNEAGLSPTVNTVAGGIAVFWARRGSVAITDYGALSPHSENSKYTFFKAAASLITGDGTATVSYTTPAPQGTYMGFVSLQPSA